MKEILCFIILLVALQTTGLAGEDIIRDRRQALTSRCISLLSSPEALSRITTGTSMCRYRYSSTYSSTYYSNYWTSICTSQCRTALQELANIAGCCNLTSTITIRGLPSPFTICNITSATCRSSGPSMFYFSHSSAALFAVATFFMSY